MSQPPTRPILIIGAGLAGLAFAQGLKHSHIPFRIFERDASPTFRAQGYRLRIDGNGQEALKFCLPPDLWLIFQQTCAATVLGGIRLDARDGQPMDGPPHPRSGNVMPVTADRVTMRKVLMMGLEKEVEFGKELKSFEADDAGVKVKFHDGSSAEGLLLVGADGVRSAVRRLHLPEWQLLDTEARCIYGKTDLTPEFEQRFPEKGLRGMALLVDNSKSSPLTLLLESIRFLDDKTGIELPKDYVYWVLFSNRSTFGVADEVLLSMTGVEAGALSLSLTEKWDPALRSVLEFQDTFQTSAIRVASANPESLSWQSSRVTFLGDAVHAMPPTGGVGANTAVKDAATLLRHLQHGATVENVVSYEEEMRRYAGEAVLRSAQGGKHLFGMKAFEELKPVAF